jgi:tetratricopeptide (TPR) repeat protein
MQSQTDLPGNSTRRDNKLITECNNRQGEQDLICLLVILASWPAEWYHEYAQLNWPAMKEISSNYGDSAGELAVKAISLFGNGTGDPVSLALEAISLDSTDYRAWTALAIVGMQQDSAGMETIFNKAFLLSPGFDPVLSETYAFWLLSMGNSDEAVILSSASLEADSLFGPGWLTLSMALVDEERLDEAVTASIEGLRLLPGCIPLLHQYAQVLAESEQTDRAIEVYRDIVQRDSTRIQAYRDLGLLYQSTKRNGEAIKTYRELLQIRPEYTWAWSELASCYQTEGRADLADSFFQIAVELSPDDPWTLFQLAGLRAERSPDYAMELLERAVGISPDYSRAWQELAYLYESTQNFAKAESALRMCIELDPDPLVYGELGWVLENRGMYPEAAIMYETSVSIDSEYVYGWQRRGDLFEMDGDFEAAANWYTTALAVLAEEDPWILGKLGGLAVRASLTDSASNCFSRSLEIDPGQFSQWLGLARIQRAQGDFEASTLSLQMYSSFGGDSVVAAAERIVLLEMSGENTDTLVWEMLNRWPSAWTSAGFSSFYGFHTAQALSFAERAFRASPETPWDLISLGELFGELSRPREKMQCYELAAGMPSDDFQVAVRIADYYYEMNLYSRAIDLLEKTYAATAWNETLTTSLAEAYLFDNQLDRAGELFREILERNPFSVYAISYLGLVEENRGNTSDAVERYLEALRIEPGYSYAEDRLRYISSSDYNPGFRSRAAKRFNWNLWIDLTSTGGNIDEQYYSGGGSLAMNYGRMGSSVTFEISGRSEVRSGKDIRRTAWTSLSGEHFLTEHLYAGGSTSWDRQPITVRPWQVSSYLAAGWKNWLASWIWTAPEIGAGLVNTKWSTEQGRTDEWTTYLSLNTWASSSFFWLPSLWISGNIYLPPGDAEQLVANAVGELEFDLPGPISLILGTSLDYTRTPIVESWEKLDSEVYLRLRF